MTHQYTRFPLWSTSSFGEAADSLPLELAALREHLLRCTQARGRLFVLRSQAESVRRFFTARVVTTLSLCALLIGAVYMAL